MAAKASRSFFASHWKQIEGPQFPRSLCGLAFFHARVSAATRRLSLGTALCPEKCYFSDLPKGPLNTVYIANCTVNTNMKTPRIWWVFPLGISGIYIHVVESSGMINSQKEHLPLPGSEMTTESVILGPHNFPSLEIQLRQPFLKTQRDLV